jgi:hypothetical protein
MIRAPLVVAACLLAGSAAAQTRPYAPKLTCQALKDIVASAGGIVISTSPTTYARFVSNRSFCYITQITRPQWIVSADDAQCFVGYKCEEYEPNNF